MTNYFYSRFRILSFIVILLAIFWGLGAYVYSKSDNAPEVVLSSFLFAAGVFFILIYRRIIVAVFRRKPALSLTPTTIQHFGTRKFSWDEVEYYRLRRGLVKSSIEIKLYDTEAGVPLRKTLRSYFDFLPLRSFNQSILIVDLTFIIGVNEYIVQTFENYDIIGQEAERMAS